MNDAPASTLQRLWRLKRRLALFFLPWVLVLLPLGTLFHARTVDDLRAPLERRQQDLLQRSEQVLARSLATLRRDIRFLAGSDEVHRALNDGDTVPLARLLRHFARAAEQYDQLRWIDARGMERVRVDFRDGQSLMAPASALQDKSARPYFREAMSLPAGAIYLSALDLNVEHERLELPHKPTLRIATPLHDATGQPAGILVLNHLAGITLQRLHDVVNNSGLEIHLLNREGFWLLGPPSRHPWGFMTGESAATLAVQSPQLWERMLLLHEGSVLADGGLWAFHRLSVQRDILGQPEGAGPAESWYLALRMPLADLQRKEREYALYIGSMTLVVLLIALWASVRLVLAGDDREQALQELRHNDAKLVAANAGLEKALQRLQEMQDELVRAEKLSSLGLMVAGVAHELNTPLGSAVVSISALQERLTELNLRVSGGTLRRSDLDLFLLDCGEGLGLAAEALERAASLVRRFKQLAVDRATTERRSFELADVVEDSLHLLRPRQGPDAPAIHLQVPRPLSMDSYPGPLGQVIGNLVGNALLHAFPPHGSGNITIAAVEDAAHDEVLIRVVDDGCGMDAHQAAHAFDPFFTTRRGQGGTGLGLFIAHQLCTDVLGGRLSLDTAPGRGCSFILRIPRVAPAS